MKDTDKIIELCKECRACVKKCIFLSHYCHSPKELALRFKRNPFDNLEIPFSCSLCGLCQRVCKQDLFAGGMCLETRQKIFQGSIGKTLPGDFVYDFIIPRLNSVRYHQIFSSSFFFTYNKKPKNKLPKKIFFPGCSLPAYAPGLTLKIYQYLRQKIPGIGIVLNCCAKPSKDMGDEELFGNIFNKTMAEFQRLGVDEVILACINCHKIFRENSDIKLTTVYEIISQMGLPGTVSKEELKVTIHDSCPAREKPEIRHAVRNIVEKLGYEFEELKLNNDKTQCCGAGGCAPKANMTLADRHTALRASQVKGQLITYCAHCRERFSTKVPTLHILDLVFGASYKKPLREYNDGWRNWLNRWYLKKRLQLFRG